MAHLLTLLAAGPVAATGLPGPVSDIRITVNGARGNDVSGEETAAQCARFRLRQREVRAYFATARLVDERAYHHDLEMSRCHAEGLVTLADGRRGRWRIDRERRGIVALEGGDVILLHCPRCTARAFEPVHDPERDG
ncbi:hypothetical protein [Roseomonas indoligenes]|uniref:Uncharacterized protein n=1 Tax=Roseomonas indoligenes TaxID=2820811 RepID=A0A940N0H3_9PROT|nr:hypothetical protein [Pararoseomonas indoligenes]MBP0494259.1 hypothetical protein [Pararoseomonas indoligenes]